MLVILAQDRRDLRRVKRTTRLTATWAAQQVVEELPWNTAPGYLLHDRAGVYGRELRNPAAGMGIMEVRTALHRPWQSPYVERLIGSIRGEPLHHVIVLHARHRRDILTYCQRRRHQGLAMNCPEPRAEQPREKGAVVEAPEDGGLYRH